MFEVQYYDNEYVIWWKGKLITFPNKEQLDCFLVDNEVYCYELSIHEEDCISFKKVYL